MCSRDKQVSCVDVATLCKTTQQHQPENGVRTTEKTQTALARKPCVVFLIQPFCSEILSHGDLGESSCSPGKNGDFTDRGSSSYGGAEELHGYDRTAAGSSIVEIGMA